MKRPPYSWPLAAASMLLAAHAFSATITWDGEGADNDWLTPENWSDDVVPGPADDVVFDGTSSKDADISGGTIDVGSFTMQPGYGGTLVSVIAADIRFRGDFIQNGGAVNWTFSDPVFDGSMTVNGGTFQGGFARFTFTGAGDFTLALNIPVEKIGAIDIQAADGVTATIGGNIDTDQLFMRDSADATLAIEGNLTLTRYQERILNQFGTIAVRNGGVFDIGGVGRIDSRFPITQESGGIVRGFVRGASFTDADGVPVTSPGAVTDVHVTLIDPDEGLDDLATESVEVTVSSDSTGDSETIVLQELDDRFITFRNVAALPVANGVAVPGDGTLQFDGAENLTLSYTDDEDPLDTFTRPLVRTEYVWDNGGADDRWSTPENWTTDETPLVYDPVRFDATSTADCLMRSEILGAGPIVIDAAYTGEIASNTASGLGQLHCGGISQHGGTFDMGRIDYRLYGDFTLTGGVTDAEDAGFRILDPVTITIDPGTDPFTIDTFLAETVPGADVTLEGTIHHTGFFQILDQSSTVRVADTLVAGPSSLFQIFSGTTVVVQDGALYDATGFGNFNQNGAIVEEGTGIFRRNAESIAFTDDSGNLVTFVNPGGDVHITLVDGDESKDGTVIDETTVVVSSDSTGDSETLVLQEVDTRDTRFRNVTGLPTAEGAANPEDGVLQHDGVENLTVDYIDDEDPADTIMAVLRPAPFIWDAGGVDNAWTTPENWNQDAVPGVFDSVIFDGTSSNDCVLGSQPITIGNATIEPGYGGVIDLTDCDWEINGSIVANGGTFDVANSQLFVSVNADFSGAAFTGATEGFRLRMDDDFDSVVTFPNGPLTIGSVFTATAPVKNMTIFGDLSFASSTSYNNGGPIQLEGSIEILGPAAQFRIESPTTQFFVNDGSVLDLRNADEVSNAGTLIDPGTGVILRNATSLFVASSDGTAGDAFLGGALFVSIVDEDENTVGSVIDTVEIVVTNPVSGDSETLQLSETNVMSETFLNTVGLPIASGATVAEDGVLQAQIGDMIEIDYTDAEDPADVLGISATVRAPPADLWVLE